MNEPVNESTHSPFLPLLMLASTLQLFVTWQLILSVQQQRFLERRTLQNAVIVDQAQNTQAAVRRLVVDIQTLAASDSDAKALASKYGIGQDTPPSARPPASTPPPPAVGPVRKP